MCNLCGKKYDVLLSHIDEDHPELEAILRPIYKELVEMDENEIKRKLLTLGIRLG